MPEEHSPGNHTVAGLQPRRRYLMRACGSYDLWLSGICQPAAPAADLQRELLFRLKGAISVRSPFGSLGRAPAPAVSPAPPQSRVPRFGHRPPSAAISL